MAESLSRVTIEKLKGMEDYSTWKFLVRMLLIHEDLWDAVALRKGPDDKTQLKALARICLLVQPPVLTHIRNAKTAYEAWDNLENVYEGKGLTRRLGLLRTLFALKLEGFSDMQSYLNKISDVGQQLQDIGAGLEDDFLAVIMLSGLSSNYDPLIMTLENSSEKLTTESVKSRLIQEYQRRLEKDDNGSALTVSKSRNVTFLENEFHSSVTREPTDTVEVSLHKNLQTQGQSDQSDRPDRPVFPHDDRGSPSHAGSDGNITFRSHKQKPVVSRRQPIQISPISVSSIESDDPLDETYIPGETTMDSSDSAES